MKALSFRQPWAELILQGRKTIDLRTWPTYYRGRLVIHASKQVERRICELYKLDPALLVKGALVAHLTRPRKGHRIEEFAPLLPDSFPLKEQFLTLEQYSKYAWAHRYPLYGGREPIPEPTIGEVDSWIAEVAKLEADFEAWLEGREAGR